MPDMHRFAAQIRANARPGTPVAVPDSRRGRTLTICGAGPSLADQTIPATDEVWAVNSALPWLWRRDQRVTHGVTIDQGRAMLADHEWGLAVPVDYLVASSVHPDLVDLLEDAGQTVTFFHSYLGLTDPEGWDTAGRGPYETWLYRTLYGTTVMAGHGLNGVPRAVCLALGMGFDHITVLGADCAARPDCPPMPAPGSADYSDWLRQVPLYVDGRTAAVYGAEAPMAEAEIDGRRWVTRPDMLISAIHLLELEAAYPGRVTLVGDTLPNAFRMQGPEWWADLPTLSPTGAVENFRAMVAA